MAHPKIQRSLFTAGIAAAVLAVPMGGSAFALGLDEAVAPVAETVDEVIPAPVADEVDKAIAPVREAVQEQVKPVVDEILEAAPPPVREAAEKVVPSQPSAGPVSTAPVAPAAPRGGVSTTPVAAPAPARAPAAAPAPAQDPAIWRARQALLSQPMTTSPFPAITDLLTTDAPMTAAREGAGAADSSSTDASGWLVATATALLVAMGAAHVAYADGRLTKANARGTVA